MIAQPHEQSQVFFNGTISSGWEFRNSVQVQRSSDQYFVTEGVYGSEDSDEVFREPLDFHNLRKIPRLSGALFVADAFRRVLHAVVLAPIAEPVDVRPPIDADHLGGRGSLTSTCSLRNCASLR